MGNFSPYSEEWEKQHMNKVITRAMEEYAQRKAVFERLPKPIQLLIIAGEKISYYADIAYIRVSCTNHIAEKRAYIAPIETKMTNNSVFNR